MPNIIIDGNQIEALATDTILSAASRAGIEIPHFCHHPELHYAGSCRMCMVEVEKSPKLLTACSTMVSEGMIVRTSTEKVKKARAAVLEFLLINHPLDCPICDKAGECPLQDNYFKYSARESRYEEEKWHKRKKFDLGPAITHDEERCILCTRCVRFMQDIAKSPQLVVTRRGSKNTLTTYPGAPLDNPYSLNTVDICPVGALTSKDFRFKCRAWYLKSSRSVCPFCATGCSTVVQHDQNVVYRILPYKNEKTNGSFMCDYGRLFRKHINSENRMTAPVIKNNRKDASSVTTEESYEKAFTLIGERLASVLKNDGAKRTGVLISPYLSVEEAYIILKTFYEAGSNHIALIDCGEGIDGFGFSDDYLISKDKSPNKAGILELAKKMGVNFIKPETLASAAGTKKIGALIFAGPPFGMSEYYEKNKAELDSADFILSLSSHFQAPASRSDAAMPFSLWCESEGHFVNKQNMVQRYAAAVSSPAKDAPDNIQLLCRLASLFKVKLDYRSSGEVYNDIKNKLHLFE